MRFAWMVQKIHVKPKLWFYKYIQCKGRLFSQNALQSKVLDLNVAFVIFLRIDLDPIQPMTELVRDIIKTIVLSKFDKVWAKIVASRVLTLKLLTQDARWTTHGGHRTFKCHKNSPCSFHYIYWELLIRCVKLISIDSSCVISSPNPMFAHLLESILTNSQT